MQVKNPQTKATKGNSEHHKVSESTSANAQRMRATNLPCRRQPRESTNQNSQDRGWLSSVPSSSTSTLAPDCLAQKACFDKRNCHLSWHGGAARHLDYTGAMSDGGIMMPVGGTRRSHDPRRQPEPRGPGGRARPLEHQAGLGILQSLN